MSESLEIIDGFSQGYFKPPFVVHWCCSPSRNCGVLSTFNYQHSVILPRLGSFDFGQFLDTELSYSLKSLHTDTKRKPSADWSKKIPL